MTRHNMAWSLALGVCLALAASPANAQGPTLPDSGSGGTPGGGNTSLPPTPGAGGGALGSAPGDSSSQPLGGRPGATTSRAPASISSPSASAGVQPGMTTVIAPPPSLPTADIPVSGSLDFPNVTDDEGPANGLSLDDAINALVRDNLYLKGLMYEIPQAEADILTASLRNNPVFYADTQLVPYGSYTRQRPGGQTQYDVNISYPLDLKNKRKYRINSATKAKQTIEEQYKDAVRLQIDNLYTVYIDLLNARATLRYAEASVEGLEKILVPVRSRFKEGSINKAEYLRVENQKRLADLGRRDAIESVRKAKRNIANILAIPYDQADAIEARGTLKDGAPLAPEEEELIQMAMETRPDLMAFRVGLDRANADVRLQVANRFTDVYVLYQPYTLQDNTPNGLKSPTSWAAGVTIPIPINNRNQGNIRRARENVIQTKIQFDGQIRQVITDVQIANREYRVTREIIEQFDTMLAPTAKEILQIEDKRFKSGEVDLLIFLAARNDYVAVVKQYLDSLVRHRRAMLDLNTAVGRRILP